MDLSTRSDEDIRRAHGMFQANPGLFEQNPEYMHALIREYTRRFSGSSPADLDPVEASAAPVMVEPFVGPARKRGRADFAVDAATAGGLYSPSENVDSMEVGDKPTVRDTMLASAMRGVTPPGYDAFAEAMTDAETGTTRAQRQAMAEETGRRIDRQTAQYNRDTGLGEPDAISEDEGPYPGAGRPGHERTFTPQELAAQRGSSAGRPLAETVPGPRGVGGLPVRPPRPIYDADEAAAYSERPFNTDTGRYAPSPKDRDMLERGMVPVLNEDGSVGYAVGYDVDPLARGIPGAPGRAGQRKDLEDAGWGAKPVEGPMGPVQIYQPGPDARRRYKAQADARSASRLKRSAGISSAKASALPLAAGETSPLTALRKKARDAKDDDYNARNERWKAQSMLAGSNPRRNMVNAWGMMDDPGVSEEQRRSLRYMLPGGQLAAMVDAQNMQNANEVIKRFMTSGAAAGMNNPIALQQMEQMNRDKAVARADQLIKKYPYASYWNGTYSESDVQEVRNAVEKEHPGHGDAAVAHIRVAPAAPAARPGEVAPGSVPPI